MSLRALRAASLAAVFVATICFRIVNPGIIVTEKLRKRDFLLRDFIRICKNLSKCFRFKLGKAQMRIRKSGERKPKERDHGRFRREENLPEC